MRNATRALALVLVAGVLATGCSGHRKRTAGASGGPSATATGSAQAGGSGGSGAGGSGGSGGNAGGPACLVGTWKTTGVAVSAAGNGMTSSASGGAGGTLTIGPDGKASANFDPMSPVEFTTSVSGADIKGKYAYAGKATGAVKLAAGSGAWQPSGAADWSGITVTVDLTAPVEARIFDHARMADFVGAGGGETGGTVDPQPLLGAGTYQCGGNTLKLVAPADRTGATWTLQRA